MIAITHFESAAVDFADRAAEALAALAGRPGYLRGTLARSTDDADRWLLVTEWENVGSYRRALGNYEVRLRATPLLAQALELPGAFEALADVPPGGPIVRHGSDRA
ncbi:MAG: hypothetical protein QOE97_2042 [Pseudonocardiales bacterium]|nr:hypothetical protein [Pseudonocardiales bacterium]